MARLLVAFSSTAVVLAGLFSGCASDDTVSSGVGDGVGGGGPDASAPTTAPPMATGTGTAPPAPTSTNPPTEPTGSCNPDFCPEDSFGERCCVSPNGPCGVDMGMGCTSGTMADPGADGG